MIGALSGGDSLEIVVALKNLTAAGFSAIRKEMATTEAAANRTSLGGFSKAAKAAEKDAEGAAGGIGGLGSGLLGLAGGPVGLAVAGLGAATAAGIALTKTYDDVERQVKALDIAMRDHGESLAALQPKLDDLINSSAQYGFGADDVRLAVTRLTEAGHSWADVEKDMPAIMDLAAAGNMSLADATKQYELAIMGNARALKQYGIALPPVAKGLTDVAAVQDKANKSAEALRIAQEELAITEAKLGKHHTLTAAEALQLQKAHDKVTAAEKANEVAQKNLTLAQQGGVDVAARQELVNKGVTKALDGQRGSATEMQIAQTNLNNAWERMAVAVGPGLQDLFARLVNGIGKFINMVMDAIGWLGNLAGQVGHVGDMIANSPIGQMAGGAGDVWAHTGGGLINNVAGFLGGHAEGGWVGLHGPELSIVGERGPEFVVPNHALGALGGTTVLNVHFNTAFVPTAAQARQLADALEGELGRRFARTSTGVGLGLGGI